MIWIIIIAVILVLIGIAYLRGKPVLFLPDIVLANTWAKKRGK